MRAILTAVVFYYNDENWGIAISMLLVNDSSKYPLGSGLQWILHIPLCVIRGKEWGGPTDETGKTEAPCRSGCNTIKIPPCSKVLSAEHRPKFCTTSPVMVTSPYKWKISWAGRKTINNQSTTHIKRKLFNGLECAADKRTILPYASRKIPR
jgi:hypothetical protein